MAAALRRKQSAQRIPDVDPKSPAGVQLTDAVQIKMKQFLGADYVDRSLAQYVVVMLAHKTEHAQLADNLVEFLGEVDSKELASWLFESLDELLRPPPAPQQEQQQRQQQQQQQQRQLQAGPPAATQTGAAAEAVQAQAQAQAEPEGLQLEVEGGSDADTAEVALTGHRRTSDEGEGRGIGRRLQSAVVVDEYRRRDHRLGRSRSRSPRRRHSYSPPRGMRHSPPPPRRRSPTPSGGPFMWEGGTGSRYFGHDPYPYRAGGAWRGERSPPRRRRSSPPPYGYPGPGSGRGHGHGVRGEWGPPPPRGGAYMDGPRRHEGGGGSGVFGRLLPGGGSGSYPGPQQHFQHDMRWEEEEEKRQQQQQYEGRGQLAPPPGLAPGMPHPGHGAAAADAYDARMGQEHLHQSQQQHQTQQEEQQDERQALPPWERLSYMDLELRRQQQQAAAQQQQQQQHAYAPAAAVDPAAAGALARALAQEAASSSADGRSVAAVPLALQRGAGPPPATFQVTITQGGGQGQGARGQLTAPLLHQPDLQQVLRQRLRQMELELVKLRAEQAERLLADVHRRQELSTSAKLDLTVRSACVKGVHPAASERVLIAHFGTCGYIQRITFLRDPVSGRKTGVVYLQFSSAVEAQAALALDGSSLLQRNIQVVPSDSPVARVAVSRALRSSFPPPGLVSMPLFPAPMPMPPCHNPGRGMHYSRSGGRGGRGGRGHGTFKYVRPANEPAPGSAAAPSAVGEAGSSPSASPAAALAAAAGHGGTEASHPGGDRMVE